MDRSEKELLQKLEKLLKGRIQPLFARYGQNIENLLAPLRWKPLVLIIGNYSSGKSTLINELLEREVQRVGQSPTDDSFTIISSPEQPGEEKRIPGGSVVGETDDEGGRPIRNEYFTEDVMATIYHKLNLPPDLTVTAPDGRPVRLNHGNVIREWV